MVVARKTDADAAWRVFDAVEIDLAGRRLFIHGREVALEPKAFDALSLLVEHAGRVCTREELLDAVWGHRHITPSVLSRVITLLRQALGEQGDEPRYLHTVHGIGYRFDAEVRAASRPPRQESNPGAGAEVASLDMQQTFDPAAAIAATSSASQRNDYVTTRSPAPPRKPAPAALLAAALIGVLGFAGWMLWPRPPQAATAEAARPEQRSIAVLPLASAGAGPEQQVLSEGLSENLITTLSQFEGLKVIGRSSSFRFADGKEGAQSIGAKLGVTHLIEGSVQRDGDDLRIGIRLVSTADGSTVWTRRFDQPYRNLFALQDEIALAVVGALQVKLLHAMAGTVESGRPASGNLDAYQAYLRGAYYMGDGKDSRKAIEQFTEATRIDPGYAQAWSWLGFLRTQYARNNLEGDAARDAYAQARREIETALKLAPDFGQAHGTFGNLLRTADYDWNGAEAELRKAVQLASETDPVHGALSRLLATQGKIKEAIEERRKYLDGDPLSGFAHVYLAQLQASLGRLDDATTSLRKATEVAPGGALWYAAERSYQAILRGDPDTALAEARRMSPGRWQDRTLALALQIGSDRAAADAALQHLIETDDRGIGGAFAIARVHALRGDAEKTFEWLQRDWERRDAGVHDVLYDPLLLRFRDDPRFAEYCRKTGLPSPNESEALGIERIRAANSAKR